MRHSTALLTAALLVAGCDIKASYNGSQYACSEPPFACPTGLVCADGWCVDPATIPDPTEGRDASPEQLLPDADLTDEPPPPLPPDAAPAGTPDAGDPPVGAFEITLGERSDALIQGVAFDNWVTDVDQITNFGGDDTLSIDAAPQHHALMRFDLSAVPPQLTIVKAELVLGIFDPIESGEFVAFALAEDWSESQSTWLLRRNNLPWSADGAGEASRLATPVASFAPRTTGVFTVELPPALLQAWLDAPGTNFGLVWVSTSLDGRGGQFESCESPLEDQRPLLRLTVAP